MSGTWWSCSSAPSGTSPPSNSPLRTRPRILAVRTGWSQVGNNSNSDFSCRTEQVREAGQVCDQVQGLNFLQLRLLCPHKVCCKCFRGNSIISEDHNLYFTHFIETFKLLLYHYISIIFFIAISIHIFANALRSLQSYTNISIVEPALSFISMWNM